MKIIIRIDPTKRNKLLNVNTNNLMSTLKIMKNNMN